MLLFHKIIIIFSFLFTSLIFFQDSSYADYVDHYCTRYYLDPAGFNNKKGAESWFPKNLTVKTNKSLKKAKYLNYESSLFLKSNNKRMDANFGIRTRTGVLYNLLFYFLPNGEMHLELNDRAGYQSTGGGKYKCTNWPYNNVMASNINNSGVKSEKDNNNLLRIFREKSNLNFYVHTGSHLKINLKEGYFFYHGKHKSFSEMSEFILNENSTFYSLINWSKNTNPQSSDLNWINTKIIFKTFFDKKYAIFKIKELYNLELDNNKKNPIVIAIKINNRFTGSKFVFNKQSNEYSFQKLINFVNQSDARPDLNNSTISSAELEQEKQKRKTVLNCVPSKAKNILEPSNWNWHNCIGTIEYKEGKFKGWKYNGEFKNGKPHGKATTYQQNGDKYVGNYRNGKKNGKGTFYFLRDDKFKGDIYIGNFKDGKRHGKGTYNYNDGDVFEGEYKDGLRHGKGTYFALRDDKFKGDIFIGQYKNGKKDGYGTYIHKNGNKYEGNYKNNELHGFGIYNYNGFEYRGEYKNGKRHGEGILKWPSGKIQEGIWKNGKFLDSKNLKNQPNSSIALNQSSNSSAELEQEKQKRKTLQKKANEEESKRKALEQRVAELEKKNKELQKLREIKQKPSKEIGSGFYVSKFRHIVTNQHVVNQCKKITVGDSISSQIPADLIASDKRNDLAILQTISMEMASADTKSFVQKLAVQIVPIISGGLMRSEDVRGGEEILVAGYPLGDMVSDTIKVTRGIVSATKGIDNDVSLFEIDAVIRKGNSGGPIYDKRGNIVGVAVSRLNVNRTDTINFGIKGSTVKQFLSAHDIPTKWSNRNKDLTSKDIYKIASKQTVMIVCHR